MELRFSPVGFPPLVVLLFCVLGYVSWTRTLSPLWSGRSGRFEGLRGLILESPEQRERLWSYSALVSSPNSNLSVAVDQHQCVSFLLNSGLVAIQCMNMTSPQLWYTEHLLSATMSCSLFLLMDFVVGCGIPVKWAIALHRLEVILNETQ